MAELKPKSFRIDDQTMKQFKELTGELGGNQQQTLQKLIETYEFQRGKQILTERKADIDDFEKYVTLITKMYMLSLENNQNTKELVRADFDSLLKSKDKTIQELQSKLETLEKEKKCAYDEKRKIEKENTETKKELNTSKELCHNLEETKGLLQEKLDEKEKQFNKFKIEMEKIKQLTDKNKSLEKTLNVSEKEKERMNIENEKKLLELNKEHQKAIAECQQKYFQLKEEKLIQEVNKNKK